MCFCLPSTNAEMTLPNAERDKLIFVASLNRSPVAPVLTREKESLEVIRSVQAPCSELRTFLEPLVECIGEATIHDRARPTSELKPVSLVIYYN